MILPQSYSPAARVPPEGDQATEIGKYVGTFIPRAVRVAASQMPRRPGSSEPATIAMYLPSGEYWMPLTPWMSPRMLVSVMVAPAGHLRSDDQIFDYYASVAEALGAIPFVLQDYPLTTNVQIPPAAMSGSWVV